MFTTSTCFCLPTKIHNPHLLCLAQNKHRSCNSHDLVIDKHSQWRGPCNLIHSSAAANTPVRPSRRAFYYRTRAHPDYFVANDCPSWCSRWSWCKRAGCSRIAFSIWWLTPCLSHHACLALNQNKTSAHHNQRRWIRCHYLRDYWWKPHNSKGKQSMWCHAHAFMAFPFPDSFRKRWANTVNDRF